jgi:hypothetical protein
MAVSGLHRQVASIALAAAAEHGFALGGGNALLAHGLTTRPTQDVDLFTDQEHGVDGPAAAVEQALADAGLQAEGQDDTAGLADLFPGMGQGLAEWIVTSPGGEQTAADPLRAQPARHRCAARQLRGLATHPTGCHPRDTCWQAPASRHRAGTGIWAPAGRPRTRPVTGHGALGVRWLAGQLSSAVCEFHARRGRCGRLRRVPGVDANAVHRLRAGASSFRTSFGDGGRRVAGPEQLWIS